MVPKVGQHLALLVHHSGVVFEPVDEFKGDIARGCFSMSPQDMRRCNIGILGTVMTSTGDTLLDGSGDQGF